MSSPGRSDISFSSSWPSPKAFKEMILRQLWGGRAFVAGGLNDMETSDCFNLWRR